MVGFGRRGRDEDGAASTAAIALVAATVMATGMLLPICSALSARQQVAGAADAAALAAANAAAGLVDGPPCDAAARTARRNGAHMEECRLAGLDATVTVSTTVALATVTGSARAGQPRTAESEGGARGQRDDEDGAAQSVGGGA